MGRTRNFGRWIPRTKSCSVFRVPPPTHAPAAAPSLAPGPQPDRTTDLRVPFNITGMPPAEARALVEGLPGAVWASEPGQARLIWQWNSARPRLITGLNKFVSFDAKEDHLPGVIAATGTADRLAARISAQGFAVHVTDDRGRARPVFTEAGHVRILATGLPGRNLVVFNVTWDGLVQFLFPDNVAEASIAWPNHDIPIGDTAVVKPFGEDHVFAVSSRNSLSTFTTELQRMARAGKYGEPMAEAAGRLVTDLLDRDHDAALAMASLFTVSKADKCQPEIIRDAQMQQECSGTVPFAGAVPP